MAEPGPLAVVRTLVDPACASLTDQRVVVDGGTS